MAAQVTPLFEYVYPVDAAQLRAVRRASWLWLVFAVGVSGCGALVTLRFEGPYRWDVALGIGVIAWGLGLLGIFANRWLLHRRRRTRIEVQPDGLLTIAGLWGPGTYQLDDLSEVVLRGYEYSATTPGAVTLQTTYGGFGHMLDLKPKAGKSRQIWMPGGLKYFPGDGAVMDSASSTAFLAALSRFTAARAE